MAANVKRTREEGTICVTNVATAKASGKLIVVGELVCMHKKDQVLSATDCPVWVDGVEVLYAKLLTDLVTEGLKLYFDVTNDRLTTTSSTHKQAGVAAAAAATTAATCRVHLGLTR